MGETPTLIDSLSPQHRQFSLEDVEDHYLEWLEKWIAEIESGPPDTCRGRYRLIRGSPILKTYAPYPAADKLVLRALKSTAEIRNGESTRTASESREWRY